MQRHIYETFEHFPKYQIYLQDVVDSNYNLFPVFNSFEYPIFLVCEILRVAFHLHMDEIKCNVNPG